MWKTRWFQPSGGEDAKEKCEQKEKSKKKSRKTEAKVEGILYTVYTSGSELKKQLQDVEDKLLKGEITRRIRVV